MEKRLRENGHQLYLNSGHMENIPVYKSYEKHFSLLIIWY